MYQYQTLENTSYEQIAECFRAAFSDYYFSADLSAAQLQKRLEMSGVDLAQSYGAFQNGRLVGFLFNTRSVYNGQNAVFDAGTGVVPEHRGKQVFTRLFQFAEQQLARQNVQAYYLEVLQQNRRAIRLYQRLGFSTRREYVVFKGDRQAAQTLPFPVQEQEFSQFEVPAANCRCVDPCFEHTTPVLKQAPQLYRVWYRQAQDSIAAFCVFEQESGAVVQMGYRDLSALGQIFQNLVSKFPAVVVKNVDTSYPEVLELLRSLRFQEVARQYEMSRELQV